MGVFKHAKYKKKTCMHVGKVTSIQVVVLKLNFFGKNPFCTANKLL